MILQALNDYYERKKDSGELAPEGFERKQIPFVLVLDESGALVQIDDTRSGAGKKKQARSFVIPQTVKKTSGVAANLLWDTAEYALGIDTRGRPKRVAEQRAAFMKRLDELKPVWNDTGLAAVRRYLTNLDLERLGQEPLWAEIHESNPLVSFRLSSDGSDTLICQRPAVVAALQSLPSDDQANEGFCLARGETDTIARLHPAIKGVWNAQTSGANIVSFNLAAFNSYGKDRGANAPVGERAAFTYTTALNHLLRKGSSQRLQVGDASTVFWATEKSGFENDFAAMFGAGDKDDPDRNTQTVRNLLKATETGVYLEDDAETRFCVLGLAPNAARIAVRFWQVGLVKDFALHIRQHFDDIEIVRPGFEKPYPSLFRLLNSIALQNKSENVPPDLAGDTMRSILTGLPYPAMLLQAAVRRCRAEQNVNFPRAAILKASLNRLVRSHRLNAKELLMSLDRSNTDPGYRLGRLFSSLERIQSAAQPGINATIRDRYYGAASSSPSGVFPVLLRLKNHHLSKLDNPRLATWFEKLLGEIFEGIDGFPPHLSLSEQGLFAVGYYHQQQDFFKGKPKDTSDPSSSDSNGEQ
ncbi:MAG: type I-C CRISPR-associated protein Cas8c/Csd1 [Rhodanobacteraceae bacterium]